MAKQSKKATAANAWKGKGVNRTQLELPSGNVMTVKRVGIETLLANGKVPNGLLAIMQNAMNGKKTALNMDNVSAEQVGEMFTLFDNVCLDVCIDPKVHPVPEDEADRDEDELYIDDVDQVDKSFIFNWTVGGSSDLAKFREQLATNVDTLSQGGDVVLSAERVAVDQ